MSIHGADTLSTSWGNRGDLAFCQPHGSYVTSTPWGRVQQKCASRYVHPMGPGTGESVNSMGPGSQRVKGYGAVGVENTPLWNGTGGSESVTILAPLDPEKP